MQPLWSLLPDDLALLAGRVDAGKLGFAVQLAFWRQHGRFPDEEADVAPTVVAHLAAQIDAAQIGVGADALNGCAWAGRSGRRHRVAIIDHLAVAAFDEAAEARFRRWLADDALPREFAAPALDEELSAWFARSRVTRPGAYRLGRILRSAQATHDDAARQRVADRLDAGMRERLGALLADDGDGTAYARLAADPGRVGLESLLAEIAKLGQLRGLALPSDLLRGLHPDQAKRFRRRAAVESACELRRHSERIRLPLLAFWCAPREAEIVDGLVEEAREVRGKAGILFRVVKAASGSPEGVVREVILPVIGEQAFEALVREAHALGTPQSRRVHTAVRASYGSHYRRMMPKLLAALDFRSNNGTHHPLLDALHAIRRAEGKGRQFFKADEVTIEGVIRPKWRDVVLEDAPGGGQRANRVNYEICVLQTLRERLRCKEVWVVGAGRFRNPDADLPAGFAERRAKCCERLGLPTEARAFTDALRAEMTEAQGQLNRGMPRDPGVRLDPRRRHPIIVGPLEPQPEPSGLGALKTELVRRWSTTGLLDVFKEADLRIGFTEAFATAASRASTDRDEVRRRLLPCLHGLGTNAGLKRLAVGPHGFSYKELLHTWRRHVEPRSSPDIDAESLRDVTRRVANATLAVRDPRIWGENTTACASNSKHFGAFDQTS